VRGDEFGQRLERRWQGGLLAQHGGGYHSRRDHEAALATAALATVDAVVAYARESGCEELAGHSSDDVLAKLSMSLAAE